METIKTCKTSLLKKKSRAFGKDIFLLGEDADGTKYWLESAKWDCDWYWGFGYVETYTNNNNPSKASDISSHQHIDSSFMGKTEVYNSEKQCFVNGEYIHNIYDSPRFAKTTFTEKEGWTLSELFKTFYILKETAEMYHTGGAHCTTNPLSYFLKRQDEENHINKVILPKVFEEIYKILRPESE